MCVVDEVAREVADLIMQCMGQSAMNKLLYGKCPPQLRKFVMRAAYSMVDRRAVHESCLRKLAELGVDQGLYWAMLKATPTPALAAAAAAYANGVPLTVASAKFGVSDKGVLYAVYRAFAKGIIDASRLPGRR